MGCSNEPAHFMQHFYGRVRDWNMAGYQDFSMAFRCKLPFAGSPPQDASLTSFVDDLMRFVTVPEGTAEQAGERSKQDGDSLDSFVAPAGYRQNRSKEELVCWLPHRDEVRNFMKHEGGRRLQTLLHLGSWFSPLGSFVREREARRAACLRGWATLRGFWHSSAPWGVKRLMFILQVYSLLLLASRGTACSPASTSGWTPS